MEPSHSAEQIASALSEAFGQQESRPAPEEIERVLRPFAPVSYETEEQVRLLLMRGEHCSLAMDAGCWFEANDVVSGDGGNVERRIQFLLRDTCTCVLDHLPQAIAHARHPVDRRISTLLGHPYLKKKAQK
ncbi:MAG: hypothetical protein V1876_01345 [Candidatus Peregrinibacteria bacterium]